MALYITSKNIRLATCSSFLALSGFAAPTVYAQQTAPEASGLEEIVVSARRREEKLADVPLAVSVATQEQLDRDQIYNINDLARITPALEVNQSFGGEATGGGRLRGIGTGVFNRSVSPSVAYVIDNVPQGNLNFPSMYDLAQVEVLRGPQGTLFGQGASAGVLNITTIKPEIGEFNATAGIDYAPEDEAFQMTTRGAVNIPLGEIAALRLAGQYREDSGLQTNVITGNDTDARYRNMRARLLVEPSDGVSNDTKIEWNQLTDRNRVFFGFTLDDSTQDVIDSRTRENCGITLFNDFPRENCHNFDDNAEFEAFSISNVLEFELGGFDVTSVTAFKTIEERVGNINFSRNFGFGARDSNLSNEYSQISQEIRFAYTGESYDVVFGAFYNDYEFETRPLDNKELGLQENFLDTVGRTACDPLGQEGPPFGRVCNPTFQQEDTANTTLAVFADSTFTLNDQWQVFGGIRFTDFENETQFGVINTLNTPDPDGFVTSDETNVSGRLGARFQPTDSATYFGSVGIGYKPSAVVAGQEGAPNVQLDPEDTVAFELGAKFDMGGYFIEANLFHTSLEGYQIQRTEFSQSNELISTADNVDVTSYGFEITSYGNITDSLSYNVGYIYNNATYDDGVIGDDFIDPLTGNTVTSQQAEDFVGELLPRDISGEQLVLAPEHKLTLSGEYSKALGTSAATEFFVNANVVYVSDILQQPRDPELYTEDGWTNIGGAVGLRSADNSWRTSVWVRNLLEERTRVSALANPGGGDAVRFLPAAGITTRLIGVSFDMNF